MVTAFFRHFSAHLFMHLSGVFFRVIVIVGNPLRGGGVGLQRVDYRVQYNAIVKRL
jgi:hypothetical protein